MPLRYDLHCHSTQSDGVFAPAAVVARASERKVDVLALTDHDEVGGLGEAQSAAEEAGIRLIAGTEISVSWEKLTIHIVGLGIDPEDSTLREGLATNRSGRDSRARAIADKLAESGIAGAYEGAKNYVTSARLISRTHFARYLVEMGHGRDVKDIFKRYLTRGKPGYVAHQWAALADAVRWIHTAGGRAVIAHPGRYDVSPTGLRRLIGEFKDLGGDAIEVLSSSHTPAQFGEFATHARVFGLLGSSGSDWHSPDESWIDLGGMPELPFGVTPVWHDW